ncbi:prenyltransferase family protein [Wolffia australiana]
MARSSYVEMERAVKRGGRRGVLVGSRKLGIWKARTAMEKSSDLGSSSSSAISEDSSSLSSLDAPAARLTVTQQDQLAVERSVFAILQSLADSSVQTQNSMLELWRDKHIEFLSRGLKKLSGGFQSLDSSRPWLCYWILHSLALLGESLDSDMEDDVLDFLSRCQNDEGGYGGGPGQLPHLATTYAAVNSLITVGSGRAYSSVNRHETYSFMMRMKDVSGGFRMHENGEIDVRACYTAISVASCLNILNQELVENVGNYILRCQTYEGGIGGEPGSEAHGGYTFCGLATMVLIGEADKLDLPALINWAVSRQGVECGFQGRTNKLVDGCYSFWQGGVLVVAQRFLSIADEQLKFSILDEKGVGGGIGSHSTSELSDGSSNLDEHPCMAKANDSESIEGRLFDAGLDFLERESEWGSLFHSIALQQYILLCCQVLDGGLRDKPGKPRDHYHTCYCLSGLSLCQYSWSKRLNGPVLAKNVLGPYANLVEPIHPLYGLVLDKYSQAKEFFSSSPI